LKQDFIAVVFIDEDVPPRAGDALQVFDLGSVQIDEMILLERRLNVQGV
jgi:hypothetical protein